MAGRQNFVRIFRDVPNTTPNEKRGPVHAAAAHVPVYFCRKCPYFAEEPVCRGQVGVCYYGRDEARVKKIMGFAVCSIIFTIDKPEIREFVDKIFADKFEKFQFVI